MLFSKLSLININKKTGAKMTNNYKKNFIRLIIISSYVIVCFAILSTPNTEPLFFIFAFIPVVILNFKMKKYKMGIFLISGAIIYAVLMYFNNL